jgi:ParB family chromosome partitioning protein
VKLVETGSFPIAEIVIGDRLRDVDDDWARGLAATIQATGLQNPVQLLKIGNKFRLVAGAHRVRAFQLLEHSDIPAAIHEPETDQPELELRESEIIENIGRRELSALDRAAHIAELAAIQKAFDGERRGGDRKSGKSKAQQLRFWSLSDEVASKMRLSSRTIEADLELFRGLTAAARKRVAGSWLADARNQLRELSKLHETDQHNVLDLLLGPEPKANKVSDALCIIEKRPKARTDNEKLYKVLTKAWLSAPKKVKTQFLEFLREQGAIGGEA